MQIPFTNFKFFLIIFLFFLCSPLVAYSPSNKITKIAIIYDSNKNRTAKMAEAVAEGARQSNVEVVLKRVTDATLEDVVTADAVIIGSPVYNSNISPKLQEFINRWPFKTGMRNKIGAAFVTGGGISSGQETTMLNILTTMLVFGMIPVGGEDWYSAFGASAITGEEPFKLGGEVAPQFLAKARGLGKRVATIATVFKNNSLHYLQ